MKVPSGCAPMKKHWPTPRTHCSDLSDENHPWRHDSAKLAQHLIEILDEYTGPLA